MARRKRPSGFPPGVATSEKEVFKRVSQVAKPLLTAASRGQFKRLIEDHTEYRQALVASRQGWVEDIFVFADGSTSKNATKEVIVAFDPDYRAARVGSLLKWADGLAPIVANQAIPLTVLCAGLAGPLLRFLPPDYDTNVIIELVGKRFRGKSALALAAQSQYSGDPSSTARGAVTWDITGGGIDNLKKKVRDGASRFG